MAVENRADIIAIMGASGSGKSLYMKQEIKRRKARRLIVFDPMAEYSAFATPETSMAAVAAAAKKSTFRIAFNPRRSRAVEQFDLLCQIAYAVGEVLLVVDELSIVTKPGWAPAGWGDCSMRGRHKGMSIMASSQRPASIDKDFWGNATSVRTGRLNFASDIKTMSNVLHVPGQQISLLQPLEFIARDMQTGEISTGSLKI